MKRTEPLQIGQIIQNMIDATGLRPELERRTAVNIWPDVVGKHLASYTGRIYVKEDVLHVHISSAVIKEELGYAREQLVDKINQAVGEDVIKQIILH